MIFGSVEVSADPKGGCHSESGVGVADVIVALDSKYVPAMNAMTAAVPAMSGAQGDEVGGAIGV